MDVSDVIFGAMVFGLLASATAAEAATPELVYQGRHVSADDATCILAADPAGQPFLFQAGDGTFKRIEKSKLLPAPDGPGLGEGAVFTSADGRWAVAADGRGRAFMAPRRQGGLSNDRWSVSERSAGGPWKPSDTLPESGAVEAMAGRDGAAWAVGSVKDAATQQDRWVVRRRAGDKGWQEVDRQPGQATAVQVSPTGMVYVAGTSKGQWLLRRSSDDGKTWTTVDRFQLDEQFQSEPRAIASDGEGHVHVVGYGARDTLPSADPKADAAHWIVRSSSDGGLHFSTSDDFNPTQTGEAKADDVLLLPSGDAVVVGVAGVRPRQRIVRVLRRGETQWETVSASLRSIWDHRFALAPGQGGTIYVGGAVQAKRSEECLIERVSVGAR